MKPFQRENTSATTVMKEDANTRPETLVAVGDVRAEAALQPNRPTHEKDSLQAQALQAYQTALDHNSTHLPALLGMAHVYSNMQDKDKAIATYQTALKAHSRNAAVWYEQGCCYGQFKDWNSAIDSLHQSCQLDPDNRVYRKMLGMTLARAGRFEESYAWLIRSMSEPDARYNLGRMMMHLNQEAQCREQMQLALQVNPNYFPAKEFLKSMNGEAQGTPAGAPVMPAGFNEPISSNDPLERPTIASNSMWDDSLLPARSFASVPQLTAQR